MEVNKEDVKTKALSLWQKVLDAYKSNPLKKERKGEITCPKCKAKNIEVAVSCKECGEKFEYQSAKKGVILGVGLTASVLLVISTWTMYAAAQATAGFAEIFGDAETASQAEEAGNMISLLWAAAIAGIVATAASYKMNNWGWKLQSIVCAIYILVGLSEGSLVGALLVSPLIVSAWLGYKLMVEAGQYLDSLHSNA